LDASFIKIVPQCCPASSCREDFEGKLLHPVIVRGKRVPGANESPNAGSSMFQCRINGGKGGGKSFGKGTETDGEARKGAKKKLKRKKSRGLTRAEEGEKLVKKKKKGTAGKVINRRCKQLSTKKTTE